MAAAKARNKTLDEYIAGGWTRWVHIHEELAFDQLQGMQLEVDEALADNKRVQENANASKSAGPRGRTGSSVAGETA